MVFKAFTREDHTNSEPFLFSIKIEKTCIAPNIKSDDFGFNFDF